MRCGVESRVLPELMKTSDQLKTQLANAYYDIEKRCACFKWAKSEHESSKDMHENYTQQLHDKS